MLTLLAQIASVERRPEENAARAAAAVAARPEADLAVFPELYLSGYSLTGLDDLARSPDDPELAVLRDAAATSGTAIVVGFHERRPDGVANAAACIDRDGRLVAIYRKVQLFGAEHGAFVPGNELLVVELAGRRVAPLVCFDVEFPETARGTALAGADLLVTVSANMEPFYGDHELATRARSLENRVPHLYANAIGTVAGFELVGGSRSIASDGSVLAELSHRREELLVAPVGEVERDDERVDYLQQVPAALPVVRA